MPVLERLASSASELHTRKEALAAWAQDWARRARRTRPVEWRCAPDIYVHAFQSSVRGKRPAQEDRLCVHHSRSALVAGCFDGHYGHRASDWAAARLAKDILGAIGDHCPPEKVEAVLSKSFVRVDEQWLEHAAPSEFKDGSTAVVALVHAGMLHVANVGDSRAVACCAGEAHALSSDHTGRQDAERARIEQLGGQLSVTGRVRGKLMVTRAIGDLPYKRGVAEVIARPEVRSLPLSPSLEFVVLASDGLWDVLSSAECVSLARVWMGRDCGRPPQQVAHDLTALALERGSLDNVSVALLVLQHGQTAGGAVWCSPLPRTLRPLGGRRPPPNTAPAQPDDGSCRPSSSLMVGSLHPSRTSGGKGGADAGGKGDSLPSEADDGAPPLSAQQVSAPGGAPSTADDADAADDAVHYFRSFALRSTSDETLNTVLPDSTRTISSKSGAGADGMAREQSQSLGSAASERRGVEAGHSVSDDAASCSEETKLV